MREKCSQYPKRRLSPRPSALPAPPRPASSRAGALPWNVTVYPEYLNIGGTNANRYIYGTSLGLDRPLPSILSDIRAAVNPSLSVLGTAWPLATSNQWCPTYSGQPTGRLGTGSASTWLGLSCVDAYSGVSATTRVVYSGTTTLSLGGQALGGTLPVQLRELRYASYIDVSNTRLSGTIPSVW